MKLEDVKLSHIRNFLKWYKELETCPFTKKALWRLQKVCWEADLEVYWDYRDEITSEQVDKMLTHGLAGYDQLYMECHDYNYDHMWEMKSTFIKELSMDLEDLTKEFIESVMKDCECEEDEVIEYAETSLFEFIRETFEEELQVDLNIDELIKGTSGEVWVDCEDFYAYDFIDPKSLDAEKLLFSRLRDPKSVSEIDIYEEEIGCAGLDDLDESKEFSVCIADSLDEYLCKLGEAQRKSESDDPTELYFMARVDGSLYNVDRDNVYLAREPNYETNDSEVVFMDEKTWKETPCSAYEGFGAFEDAFNNHIYSYTINWWNDNKHNLSSRDRQGRSVVHYALCLNVLHEIVGEIKSQGKEHLYQAEDIHGVSPLSLVVALSDEEDFVDYEQTISTFMKEAYAKTLNTLPRKNETCLSWETKSNVMGNVGDTTFAILECNSMINLLLEGYNLETELLCFHMVHKEFMYFSIDFFDNIRILDTPITVYLDGTVAA